MFKPQKETTRHVDIALEFSATTIQNQYCVYSHSVSGILYYIGFCKFEDVLRAPDAKRNVEWQKLVAPQPVVQLQIVAVADRMHDASNLAFTLRRLHKPHCNVYGRTDKRSTPILCVETGERYETAAAACRALGIEQSTMSNHLNNRPGYKTIHAKTFKRV